MKRILITGCQRSGTTLMGLIMDSHPLIKNVDEAEFNSIEDLSSKLHSCAKLPQESANIDFIKNEFEPDIVIWMVRNPFDVVKSMLSLHIKRSRTVTESWASTFSHVEISRILQYLPNENFSEYSVLINRYRSILSQGALRDTENGMIISAVTCWVLKQLGLQAFRNAGMNIHVVRYEDLLLNPEPVLKSICEKAGVEYHDDMLRHHELHQGVSIGKTINNRAIDRSNIFLGGNYFNSNEISLIDNLSSKMAKNFYYPNGEQDSSYLNGKPSVDLTGDMKLSSWNLFLLESSRAHRDTNKFLFYLTLLKQEFSGYHIGAWLKHALGDDWVKQVILKDEYVNIAFELLNAITKAGNTILVELLTSILGQSELWDMFFCWKNNVHYDGELVSLLDAKKIKHPQFAAAVSGVIARQGCVFNRESQWDFLVELDNKYPKVKSIRCVANGLINTLPASKDVSKTLLKWGSGVLTKSTFKQLLYGLTTRQVVDFSIYEVEDFEITDTDTLYMAWRLGRFEQIIALHNDPVLGSRAKRFNAPVTTKEFNGKSSLYIGAENPVNLIVAFTGFASMLMHPPALIHKLINLPKNAGVLWLRDPNSRGYMSGPDGHSDLKEYEAYIAELIKSKRAKQVSVIGSSIGGTISLHFGSIEPIYRSVALSPYTQLGGGDIPDRLQKTFGEIFTEVPDLLAELGSNRPETRVYYGALFERDRNDALRFGKQPNVELVAIDDCKEHNIGEQLAAKGIYSEIFSWLLGGMPSV